MATSTSAGPVAVPFSSTAKITPNATGGIDSAIPGYTTFWTGNVPITSAASGADTACTDGDIFWSQLWIPVNTTITGLGYLVGTVGGTDKAIAALYSSTGTLLAKSALAGTTVGTNGTLQSLDFITPYAAVGPAVYYAALQFNGTTAKYRSLFVAGLKVVTNSQSGTFGTLASITPGTTFNANKGPICFTY